MLIGYPYNPSLHDLWLYEDHVITWSAPTPGSQLVRRPYAWNPNSWLYPYRKSIEAMPAVYRLLTTDSGASEYGSNLRSDPINRPVFWNSYCPWKAYFVSPTLGLQSEHWQATNTYRDVSDTFGNQYLPNGAFVAQTLVRYITHDNQIFDLSPSDMVWPYKFTSPAFGSVPVFGSAEINDCAAVECPIGIPVPPLKMVDARTALPNANTFYVDSNFKIVRVQFNQCNYFTFYPILQYRIKSFAYQPPVQPFLHDSGSVIFIEISPPTSPEAGDGVLGLVTKPVIGADDFVSTSSTNIALIPPETHNSNPAVLYQQSIGNQFPPAIAVSRPNTQAIASQTVELQILALTETFP